MKNVPLEETNPENFSSSDIAYRGVKKIIQLRVVENGEYKKNIPHGGTTPKKLLNLLFRKLCERVSKN
jgi:hypothetical protein